MSTHARTVWILAVIVMALVPKNAATAASSAAAPARNDRNWVAMHVFDTIWPFDEGASFPEAVSSIETIMQTFNKRAIWRTIAKALHLKTPPFGGRTNMGHYLMWAHFSDDFVAKHPNMSQSVDSYMWMFPQRQTDIFTAWSGDVNLNAFFTQGVQGLAAQIPNPATHSQGGNFQSFRDVVPLGEADYSGGWYMTDEQAEKLLTSFHSYPGPQMGYSFMRSIKEKPNAPYERPDADLVNGYNCGDFVMYALATAGVLSRDVSESLKVQFWYPQKYLTQPLPLIGLGAKLTNWLVAHPGSTSVPSNTVIGMAWADLLFSSRGIQFFDKPEMVREVQETWPRLNYARVWDQAHVITWMKEHAEFTGKGIVTELWPAVRTGAVITSPERTVPETKKNSWPLSCDRASLVAQGDRMNNRKLKDAGIYGADGERFEELWTSLKGLSLTNSPALSHAR